MRILFTGGSSFTGYWFIRELAAAGHHVVATFSKPSETYEGVRKERVAGLESLCEMAVGARFGDERFMQTIESHEEWDLLCHHGADVTNYKSPDFDCNGAVAANTRNLRAVLEALRARRCRRVLLTGSVFESDEGAGCGELPAFSPYGLSKALTAQIFRYYVIEEFGMRLGKFVIANPFGPFEEPRFTSYLVRSWYAGETPKVNTPLYVRDNIHVSLLAKEYARFAAELGEDPGLERVNPSWYAGLQGDFAKAVAEAMRPRLGLPCRIALARQTEFGEPRMRVNTDFPDVGALGWDEERSWDELAEYYRRVFGGG